MDRVLDNIADWLDEHRKISSILWYALVGALFFVALKWEAQFREFSYFGIPVLLAWFIAKQEKWYRLDWFKFIVVLLVFRIVFILAPDTGF